MTEVPIATQGIDELKAYQDSLRHVDAARQNLLEALRPMLGQLVDITGYPLTYTSCMHLGLGRPQIWETPVYPTEPLEHAPWEPKSFFGHMLLTANNKGLEISSTDKYPLRPDLTPLSGVLLYRFSLERVLSIALTE